jgi:2-polyprenyl-3-methyl-5-hydroxy-6-metoxy-1,4-benzoquinol methylase
MTPKSNENKIEDIPCNLCGSSSFKHLFDEVPIAGHTFSLVKCKECGLIFTRPIPDDDFFSALYGDESYEANTVSGNYCLDECLSSADHRYVLEWFQSVCKGRRHLDIGCGAGGFVESALHAGWDSYGIEPSPYAARIAQSKVGPRVKNCLLFSSDFEDESFDAITIWYVLEHVPNPKECLTACRRLIKPDGKIFIAVPNARYMFMRRFILRLLSGKPGSVYPHEHLFQYTSKTIEAYLRSTGFEIMFERCATPYMVSDSISNRIKKLSKPVVSALFAATGMNLGGILIFARKSNPLKT